MGYEVFATNRALDAWAGSEPVEIWIATIVREAFAPGPLAGGAMGSLLITVMWGIRRGLFSNEAGQGSAPIAHATAKTTEPVREGLVASLGPFIDTLLICTMTGLVIMVTGVWHDKQLGNFCQQLDF